MTTKEQQDTRFTLTEKGQAAVTEQRRALVKAAADVGHWITVTPGPFGRAYVDCTCGNPANFGHLSTHASKADANTAALRHAEEVTR